MAYTQHVMTCQAAADLGVPVDELHSGGPLADCVAILCTDAASTLQWHSHAPASIDPAVRINPDVPAQDWRTP